MQQTFIVEQLKIRLDRYLAEQLPEISRSRIQRDIEGGQVSVNGQPAMESKFVVRQGDSVSYQPAQQKEAGLQPTNTPLKVLYHRHGLLIIDKPAGLTVHPGAGFKGETLASALLYNFRDIRLVGEEHRPGIVHRLDKDTSGVILVATSPEMYVYLKDAFAERKIKKEYLALAAGRLDHPAGLIEAPIGQSRTDFRKQTTKDPLRPKPALTEYRVLERLRHGVDEYTLLLVKLHTGRTHQIRVHLASLGHPLMGDTLYAGRRGMLAGLNRQFLHAKKIEVRLPASPDANQGGPDGTWIEAESELPDDLREVLKSLNSQTVNNL